MVVIIAGDIKARLDIVWRWFNLGGPKTIPGVVNKFLVDGRELFIKLPVPQT